MKNLTNRQREVLEYIKSYIEKHSFPPTIRETSNFFSISVKGAHDHVRALERKKYIRFNANCSRTIEIVRHESEDAEKQQEVARIPLLGNVAAGLPLFAEENYDGTVAVPKAYLKNGRHFALQVKGNSMSGVGIIGGDVAIFRHMPTAENGDIVVAMVDEEAVTLKRFYKERNRVRLQPENDGFHPIYSQNVRILGKLSHILRSYD